MRAETNIALRSHFGAQDWIRMYLCINNLCRLPAVCSPVVVLQDYMKLIILSKFVTFLSGGLSIKVPPQHPVEVAAVEQVYL